MEIVLTERIHSCRINNVNIFCSPFQFKHTNLLSEWPFDHLHDGIEHWATLKRRRRCQLKEVKLRREITRRKERSHALPASMDDTGCALFVVATEACNTEPLTAAAAAVDWASTVHATLTRQPTVSDSVPLCLLVCLCCIAACPCPSARVLQSSVVTQDNCWWAVSIQSLQLLFVAFRNTLMWHHFYRAMHFSAKRGIAIACRLSVRLWRWWIVITKVRILRK